jgi:hypothetical protein
MMYPYAVWRSAALRTCLGPIAIIASCGGIGPSQGVSDGTAVNDPVFGSGYTYEDGGMRCSAVAVNNWWALTNNHCHGTHQWRAGETCYTPGPGSVIKFGGWRDWNTIPPVDHEQQQHNIREICRYPKNGEIGTDQRVDLVLLHLGTPFKMAGSDDDWQNPMWPLASTDLQNRSATCYGWGGASRQLNYRTMSYSSVDHPNYYNKYFRGDIGYYYPDFIQGGDSGSGCWVQYAGVNFLTTITVADSFGVSTGTSTYAVSDPAGPQMGVREWMDNTMFSPGNSLGYSGLLNSGPGVSSQGKNNLDVFWIDASNTLRQIHYDSYWRDMSPDSTSHGKNLGTSTIPPASVSWGPGRIDIFTEGNGNLYHVWNNGTWQRWEQIVRPGASTLASGPTVSSWGSDRLDIFAYATDTKVKHLWYDHGWGSWEDLGGSANSAPAAVSWSSGRIDVFVRGGGNAIYHKWYAKGWYPSQTTWENLGGNMSSGPAVTSYRAGRLDVFARDATTGHLVHKWFEGAWCDQWIDTGISVPAQPVAVSWGRGRIDVFAKNTDGGLWQTYFPRF